MASDPTQTMSHTPGPWRVGHSHNVIADQPAPGIGSSDDVDYYGGHLIAESVNKPNARLIAAAPDLLEALKAAIGHLEEMQPDTHWHPIGHCPVLDQARAAVAKAEDPSDG